MHGSARLPRTALPLAALLGLLGLCPPASALAASTDCAVLFELYRGCHGRGLQADSSLSCLDASHEAMTRALARLGRKNPQGAQILVELVCGTACQDAVALREAANRQEFAEAFCD